MFARSVFTGPAVLLVVAGLAVTGCAGGTSSTSSTARQLSTTPQPAGATPSAISQQVCGSDAQKELATVLGVRAKVSSPTWVDHRYACTYDYPKASPPGSFEVSVKELSSWNETYAYFNGLAAQLGRTRTLGSLGQAAFQTTDGSVIVRKDWKVLEVDDTGLPATLGAPPTDKADVAVTVADVILGCWAGD